MVVRRDGRQGKVYYHCTSYFRPRVKERCSYRRFIPAEKWEEVVWNDVCTLLRDDRWIDLQLGSQQAQDSNMEKLIRMQEFKVTMAEAKIDSLVKTRFEEVPAL